MPRRPPPAATRDGATADTRAAPARVRRLLGCPACGARRDRSPGCRAAGRRLIRELSGFGVVGGVCFVLDLALFQLLYAQAGVPPVAAKAVVHDRHDHGRLRRPPVPHLRPASAAAPCAGATCCSRSSTGRRCCSGSASSRSSATGWARRTRWSSRPPTSPRSRSGTAVRFVAYRRWVFPEAAAPGLTAGRRRARTPCGVRALGWARASAVDADGLLGHRGQGDLGRADDARPGLVRLLVPDDDVDVVRRAERLGGLGGVRGRQRVVALDRAARRRSRRRAPRGRPWRRRRRRGCPRGGRSARPGAARRRGRRSASRGRRR